MALPLAPVKTSIEELYPLIKLMSVLIKNSQKADVPTSVVTLLDIVALKTSVLKEGNPLPIQSPRKKLALDAQRISTALSVVFREATALQDMTRVTRKKLDVPLDRRFFHKRYNANVSGAGVDHLWEMSASINRSFRRCLSCPPSAVAPPRQNVCGESRRTSLT